MQYDNAMAQNGYGAGFNGAGGALGDFRNHRDGLSKAVSRPRNLASGFTTSAVFYPGAMELEADLIFVTADLVLFYVHTSVLYSTSKDAFREIITHPQVESFNVSQGQYVNIPELSSVLNVILHVAYGLAFADGPPPFEVLVDGISAMRKYGIDATMHLSSNNPHYTTLVSFAPHFPMELYTLAAQLNKPSIAEIASSHLLSYPLWSITDELASKIGSVYLNKLLALHMHRREKLKDIVLPPPPPHPPTKQCHFVQQRKLTRSWAKASADLAWDSRVDISPVTLQTMFGIVKEDVTCSLCIEQLENRVREVQDQWVRVKRTI